MIIAASRWPIRWPIDVCEPGRFWTYWFRFPGDSSRPIDGPAGHTGGEDAVNGELADAGEYLAEVLGLDHAQVIAERGIEAGG